MSGVDKDQKFAKDTMAGREQAELCKNHAFCLWSIFLQIGVNDSKLNASTEAVVAGKQIINSLHIMITGLMTEQDVSMDMIDVSTKIFCPAAADMQKPVGWWLNCLFVCQRETLFLC